MYVTRLQFHNYRNLADGEIHPHQNIHVIYGENAQGKTNLLEALWLFTGGHSFRGSKDGEIPRIQPDTGRNASDCTLTLDFFSEGRAQTAQLMLSKGRRRCKINGIEGKSGVDLVGKLCAVIFSPEHLQLVKNGPGMRRNFVDGAICQLYPGYARTLSLYRRSLQQRNALLKEIPRNASLNDTLEIWDTRLAKYGSQIMCRRAAYLRKLAPVVAEIYRGISGNREDMHLQYQVSLLESLQDANRPLPELDSAHEGEIQRLMGEQLAKSRSLDLKAGFTKIGAHRDDLEIQLNRLSARLFASQGQQRSVVLAMKLSEARLLSENRDDPPLILLDDVMSELDTGRQDYLLNHLHQQQVFITCCVPETVQLMTQGKKFHVDNGMVIDEGCL